MKPFYLNIKRIVNELLLLLQSFFFSLNSSISLNSNQYSILQCPSTSVSNSNKEKSMKRKKKPFQNSKYYYSASIDVVWNTKKTWFKTDQGLNIPLNFLILLLWNELDVQIIHPSYDISDDFFFRFGIRNGDVQFKYFFLMKMLLPHNICFYDCQSILSLIRNYSPSEFNDEIFFSVNRLINKMHLKVLWRYSIPCQRYCEINFQSI